MVIEVLCRRYVISRVFVKFFFFGLCSGLQRPIHNYFHTMSSSTPDPVIKNRARSLSQESLEDQENDHFFDDYDQVDTTGLYIDPTPRPKDLLKGFTEFLAEKIISKKMRKEAASGKENGGLKRISSSERLARKLKEFRKKMKDTPMVKLKDKVAFVWGIFLLMATEAVLLTRPSWMPIFYMLILIPLLLVRFFTYHKMKFHYFMLDFCYFCQLVTFTSIFLFPNNLALFKIMFALNNGPLAIAVIAWKNSLVFHDIDKITSLYIHIAPPLVSFCARWYPLADKSPFADPDLAPPMTLKDTFVAPVLFYLFWQICYILKTEVLDRKKLSADVEIMTSSRWLSKAKPHGIYLWLKKRGIDLPTFVMLAGVQLVYTHLTLIPIPLFFSHYWFHAAYLFLIFVSAAWTGATYYFEVFSEIYSARLKKRLAAASTTEEQTEKEEKKRGKYAPTCGSIISFSLFLAACAVIYVFMVVFFAF